VNGTTNTQIVATLLLAGFKPREIRKFKPPIRQAITTIRRKVGVPPFAGGRPVGTPEDRSRLSDIRLMRESGVPNTVIAETLGISPARIAAVIYPQRTRARDAIKRAVKRGDIIRPEVCDDCGLPGKIEAHHADYFKPLEVEFLCLRCHGLRRSPAAKSA